MKTSVLFAALAAGVVSLSHAALAQDAAEVPAETPQGLYETLGSAGDWTAIRFANPEGKLTCAVYSRPVESKIFEKGAEVNALRGERAAFITWQEGPVSESSGVVSALIGAPLADEFEGHSLETEKGQFAMFGYEDRLFVESGNDEAAVTALRAGLNLTIKAALPGEREAVDRYSLKGVVASTKMAEDACKG